MAYTYIPVLADHLALPIADARRLGIAYVVSNLLIGIDNNGDEITEPAYYGEACEVGCPHIGRYIAVELSESQDRVYIQGTR